MRDRLSPAQTTQRLREAILAFPEREAELAEEAGLLAGAGSWSEVGTATLAGCPPIDQTSA